MPLKNKRERKAYMRHWRRTNPIKYTASNLVSSARVRARKRDLPFDLTAEFVAAKLKRGRCEVTGVEFDLSPGRSLCSPSIDRYIAEKGYTQDNVRLVLDSYNMAKGAGTDEDVLVWATALVAKREGW